MPLTEPPLFRLAYGVLSATERRVLLALHHFVCDVVSWHTVAGELQRACTTLLESNDPVDVLPVAGISDCDFAGWLGDLAAAATVRTPTWSGG